MDELAKAGDVIDAAVEAGANQVYGPSLSLSDQEELYEEALEAAVADARDHAEALADAAKVSLGGVKTIVEGGGCSPPVPYAADTAMRAEVDADRGRQAGHQRLGDGHVLHLIAWPRDRSRRRGARASVLAAR